MESESRPKSTTGGQKSLANACQHRRGSGNRDTRPHHTHAVPKGPERPQEVRIEGPGTKSRSRPSTPCCLWTPSLANVRQHPKVRESKRRLVCINRTPSEAEVHTKAERPASTTFTGPPETEALNRMLRSPQGWRPWTPRPRYLPNTPYLTSTPYSPLDTKGIETTFGFSIERRQRPRSTPKPRRPSTQRARGPSYQSKGLQSTVKPIPRTAPGSATTTG